MAGKEDRKQLNIWNSRMNCLRLQERYGDYGTFRTGRHSRSKRSIIKLVSRLPKRCGENLSLLDVGCGPGHFLWLIKDCGYDRLAGLDYSLHMVRLAKGQLGRSDAEVGFIRGSCWDIPLADCSVDVSLQVDVCLHVGGSLASVGEMIRVSRRYVVFTGPSFDRFDEVTDKLIGSKIWAVSVVHLERMLNRLKKGCVIRHYELMNRSGSRFRHRILYVEKQGKNGNLS